MNVPAIPSCRECRTYLALSLILFLWCVIGTEIFHTLIWEVMVVVSALIILFILSFHHE